MGVATEYDKNAKFYKKRSFMLEIELTKMRDIVSGSECFIEKLADDALQNMAINKTLETEIREQKNYLIFESEFNVSESLRLSNRTAFEGRKEKRYKKKNNGRRRYVAMFDVECFGNVYDLKTRLAFDADLEVLELDAYVDSDSSYNEEKDLKRKGGGRSEVVKRGIQA